MLAGHESALANGRSRKKRNVSYKSRPQKASTCSCRALLSHHENQPAGDKKRHSPDTSVAPTDSQLHQIYKWAYPKSVTLANILANHRQISKFRYDLLSLDQVSRTTQQIFKVVSNINTYYFKPLDSAEICYIVMVNWYLDCSDGKESACNAGDLGSIPGWGRSPGDENGYLLQYSCLEEGAWQTIVHAILKSWT